MTRESTVLQQIARIREAKVDELVVRYRELFGKEPPNHDYQYLRRVLVYRIQEIQFGGLDPAVRDRLVAEGDEKAADKRVRGATRLDAIRGTEFRREWKGKVHVVTATGDGRFEYGGVVYASLTAVAFAITGTHRNGVKWFGLTDRMVRK